ncbi:MAG: UbiA family prenyltransferase [Candidatus Krumholzibacteriota bacterium]|nr:UbiA family prenyltransferase [Candidatus Krumholzibacteriota bacterium]
MDQGIEYPDSPEGRPSRFLRCLDYIFLLRPLVLVPVWTFFLLGAWHADSGSSETVGTSRFLSGIIAFSLLIGAVYIINQISDRVSDLDNNKLFFLPRAIITVKSAWVEAVFLILSAFAISIICLPGRLTLIMLVSLALGILYSVEPVRLKKRAVLDVLSNAMGIGVLNTLAGWVMVSGSISGSMILLPYPFAVASVHVLTALADIEGDRKNSLHTSGVALGPVKGVFVSIILMAVAGALAAFTENRLAFFACILSLPAFIFPLRSGSPSFSGSRMLVPAKISTLIFSVVAGFLFRLYLPFLVIVIIGTKAYYKRRFRLDYPSL